MDFELPRIPPLVSAIFQPYFNPNLRIDSDPREELISKGNSMIRLLSKSNDDSSFYPLTSDSSNSSDSNHLDSPLLDQEIIEPQDLIAEQEKLKESIEESSQPVVDEKIDQITLPTIDEPININTMIQKIPINLTLKFHLPTGKTVTEIHDDQKIIKSIKENLSSRYSMKKGIFLSFKLGEAMVVLQDSDTLRASGIINRSLVFVEYD
jgi:hypothetical protein